MSQIVRPLPAWVGKPSPAYLPIWRVFWRTQSAEGYCDLHTPFGAEHVAHMLRSEGAAVKVEKIW